MGRLLRRGNQGGRQLGGHRLGDVFARSRSTCCWTPLDLMARMEILIAVNGFFCLFRILIFWYGLSFGGWNFGCFGMDVLNQIL